MKPRPPQAHSAGTRAPQRWGRLASVVVMVVCMAFMLFGCGVNNKQETADETISPTVSPDSGGTVGTGTATSLFSLTNLFDITQDATFVYWTEKVAGGSAVRRTRKDGSQGTPDILASGNDAFLSWGINTDGTNVYWTLNVASAQGKLLSCPIAGGTVSTLCDDLELPAYVRNNPVDGLLYVVENQASIGRVLRFSKTGGDQDASSAAAQFITNSGTSPAYNIRIAVDSGGSAFAFMTYMLPNLTGGSQGEIRVKPCANAAGTQADTTTQIAAGLINPTDLVVDGTNSRVYWTEYDAASGGVRFASINDVSVRGTQISTSGANILPPYAITGSFASGNTGTVFVSHNAQQASAGGIVSINVATGVATQVADQVAFPLNFVIDTSFFMTEFSYPNGLAPSRLMKFTPG